MLITTTSDVETYIAKVEAAAACTLDWFARQQTSSLGLLKELKFATVGSHPVDGHALNFVEQINQTWTYLAALAATRELLRLHPEARGFSFAPGAHASQDLDVMSVVPGLVGAETFAAVLPSNNGKLAKDLEKLAGRNERHRYVFFISPKFPGTQRRSQFEWDGIEVWSVDPD
jgi:hypothetical protein